MSSTSFVEAPTKPRLGTLLLVGVLHVAAFIGLIHAFAPTIFDGFEQQALAGRTVIVTVAPDDPPPEVEDPVPDPGLAGNPGREAVPRPVTAQPPPIALATPQPVPRASSTGTQNSSGARDFGEGTGASGDGLGTGSGAGGAGQGNVVMVPTDPVKIAGDINSSADYPTPPGGRQIRRGSFVIVYVTVGVDGRASNCRVTTPSPDPEADRITCELVVERFRFEPARNSAGDPVAGTYGWRQRWF